MTELNNPLNTKNKRLGRTGRAVLSASSCLFIIFYLYGISLPSETEKELEMARDIIFLGLAVIFGVFIGALWHYKWSRKFSVLLFLLLLVINYGIWILNNMVLSR